MKRQWIKLLIGLGGMLLVVLGAARPAGALLLNDSGTTYLPAVEQVSFSTNTSCSVIQKAIDTLPAGGGKVLLPAGLYTCQTAVLINRDNVTLEGSGPGTVLRLADGANAPVLVLGQDVTTPTVTRKNIRVANLLIDGNRANQTYECWGGTCYSGGHTAIHNNGITLRRVSDVIVENVTVVGARSGGLVTEKGCRRLTVENFTATDNFYDGLAAYETEDSLFTHLHLYGNPFAGLSLDIHFNNNIVSDAVLADNGKQGIFMRDSRDNLFSAIQIRNSGEQGVFLAQVDSDANTPAAGNTFEGLVIAHSTLAGFHVANDSCVDNLLVGAQLIDNGSCIYEATTDLVNQVGVVCR